MSTLASSILKLKLAIVTHWQTATGVTQAATGSLTRQRSEFESPTRAWPGGSDWSLARRARVGCTGTSPQSQSRRFIYPAGALRHYDTPR